MTKGSTQAWIRAAACCSLLFAACADGDAPMEESGRTPMPELGAGGANAAVSKARGSGAGPFSEAGGGEAPPLGGGGAGQEQPGGAGGTTGTPGQGGPGGAGGGPMAMAGGMAGASATGGTSGAMGGGAGMNMGGSGSGGGGTSGAGGSTLPLPVDPPLETTLMAKVIKTKLLIADVIYAKQIKMGVARITEMTESKQERRYEPAKNSSDVNQAKVEAGVIYAEDIEADEVQAGQVFAQQIQYF